MSWFVSLPEPLGDAGAVRLAMWQGAGRSSVAGLGSAHADERWNWIATDESARQRTDERLTLTPARPAQRHRREDVVASVVRIPAEIVLAMAEAARDTGRTERELWAEAAREWLSSRSHGDDPPPATPAALPAPSPSRSWSEIDSLLAQLRHPVVKSDETAA